MCLNVLRCMGVSTVEMDDSAVEEITGRHAPVEEAARIHPSGNGQHYPSKSTTAAGTHTAHHAGQHHEVDGLQEAAATRKDQKEAKREATSDSGERSHVQGKKEESRSEQYYYLPAGTNTANYKESPADQFNAVVAGGQPRRGRDDGLRGSAVPAGAATCGDGRYKASDGGDAYRGSANSDSEEKSPVRAKVKESEHSAAGTNKTNSKESPAEQLNVFADGQARGYEERLRGGAAAPAGAATGADRYKTSDGAYPNSTYAYEASIIRASQEQGTGRRGQVKT